jgi:Ca2+/H+ antiporter
MDVRWWLDCSWEQTTFEEARQVVGMKVHASVHGNKCHLSGMSWCLGGREQKSSRFHCEHAYFQAAMQLSIPVPLHLFSRPSLG